jgi:hypothetical protein
MALPKGEFGWLDFLNFILRFYESKGVIGLLDTSLLTAKI